MYSTIEPKLKEHFNLLFEYFEWKTSETKGTDESEELQKVESFRNSTKIQDYEVITSLGKVGKSFDCLVRIEKDTENLQLIHAYGSLEQVKETIERSLPQ